MSVSVLELPTSIFFNEFSDLLDELSTTSGHPLICGDFNCPGNSPSTIDHRLSNILFSYNVTQRINTPTRTGASSGNLLDLLIQHEDDDPIKDVSVSDPGISDHCLITATLQHQLNVPNTIWPSARNISKLNLTTFCQYLLNTSCFSTPSDDLDTFASQIETDITHVLDVLAPVRKFAKRLGKHSSNQVISKPSQARPAGDSNAGSDGRELSQIVLCIEQHVVKQTTKSGNPDVTTIRSVKRKQMVIPKRPGKSPKNYSIKINH